MNNPITELSNIFVGINWADFRGYQPIDEEDFAELTEEEQNIINEQIEEDKSEIIRKLITLIKGLSERYDVDIRYKDKQDIFEIILPQSFDSIEDYLKIASKIFGFLKAHNLVSGSEGLTIKYGYRNEPGIIDINTDKGYITAYFVQDYQFIKKQVPIK